MKRPISALISTLTIATAPLASANARDLHTGTPINTTPVKLAPVHIVTSRVAKARPSSTAPRTIADSVTIPGIPNQPTLVTVIPFVTKDNETDAEKTKVVIPAKVGNAYGNFVLDIGAPRFNLNRTFLQPSATGEIDTITDAHRIPEGDRENAVHATIRIGTLVDTVVDPTVTDPNPKHINAFLNHMWGNFSWVFAPRLGNIGTSVLEPFETIIDYTHRRVILIRLDKAGHRFAQVPAYTPKWTTPLIDMPLNNDARQWWGIMARPDHTLDTLTTANNTETMVMDTGAPDNDQFMGHALLGYPFLSQLGIVGFNHRTHQFILYK